MQKFKSSHHAYFLAIFAKFVESSYPQDEKSALSGPIAFTLSSVAAKGAMDAKVDLSY